MLKYIGRRLLSALISISFILVIGFLIIHLQAYDPATIYLAQLRQQGADIDERTVVGLYGLDKPRAVQYWDYLTGGNRTQSQPPAAPTPIPYQPPPSTGGQNPVNDEPYDAMFFKSAGVNPFIDTEDDHLSTFAMDVDTASYTVARRYINDGYFPPQEAIRVEEFINYFDLAYPGPQNGEAFAVHLESAPSPFGDPGYYLVKIGIQGRRVRDDQRKDAVLTFVIDTSGSMDMENRLHLVKRTLLLLVSALRPADRVGIVAYGSYAYTVLEPTYASDKLAILDAIDTLQANGSTYAEEGLRKGYEMANRAFDQHAINRVILCSDGVANVGRTGADGILATITDYAQRGITLSAVGFGMGNYNDVLMEQLADKGNGNYAYVDTIQEARRIFIENLSGTLQVIARDAKIQVEFNPAVVSRYRLLGYENRAVADQDFRNDDVDAGEVGAGHSVTALYEIKFQKQIQLDGQAQHILNVYIRYQEPDSDAIVETAQSLWTNQFQLDWQHASPAFLLTAAVAEYAEILRGSYWAQEGSLDDVLSLAYRAGNELAEDERIGQDVSEFIQLVERARGLERPE